MEEYKINFNPNPNSKTLKLSYTHKIIEQTIEQTGDRDRQNILEKRFYMLNGKHNIWGESNV